MLKITMSKSASGAKKYYCEQTHKESQSAQFEYYAEGKELIGQWGGKAAARLGLTGAIDKKIFGQLCDNIDPLTGKTLTGRNDKDRTVGYDLTFNCSKSVSLAYAFGDDQDKKVILDAFHAAVLETMVDVETGMQTRVRDKGRDENRETGNIAYGAFTHFTARPIDGVPDAHLHQHVFCPNFTYDEVQGKWKAGQFRQIKQDAPYYEAVFQSKLAQTLQKAGYRIRQTKFGFELDGITKQTLDKFSRRTKEIEAYIEAHHITDEAEKAKAAIKTRQAKKPDGDISPEAIWRSRLTPDEEMAFKCLRQPGVKPDLEQEAARAVQFSLAHHFERKSVASDKEILATALKASLGKTNPDAVQKSFGKNEEVLKVKDQLRTFITTKAALKEEKKLIQYAVLTRNKFSPIHADYQPQNPLLNPQQQKAVTHALGSTDGIILITGKAGTGKTTLMKEVKEGILAGGKEIFAFAPSAEASRKVQRSEGFKNADTVASLILKSANHANYKNQVLWIDEAGMLSNKDLNRILEIANIQAARVILSGDTKQHTSVQRGDALRLLQQETGLKAVTVDKIQRQKDAVYQDVVHLLSEGKTEHGFKKLDRMGAIQEISDRDARVEAVANDYCQSLGSGAKAKEVLIVAPTHAEGGMVTSAIREQLKESGKLGNEDHIYTVLKDRQLTEAEKQRPESYQPGNVLSFHEAAKGIKAGSRLSYQSADEQTLHGHDHLGNYHPVLLEESRKYSVFEPKHIGIAEGDKIRLTRNGKSEEDTHLFNGSVFQVEGFDKSGGLKLSNGSTLPADYGHFDYGYVGTSHASQGKTADKVILSQSAESFKASSMEQFYVSVSRGREAVSIYTDDKAQLLEAVQHSSERTSATELFAKQQAQAQEINRLAMYEKQKEQASEQEMHPTMYPNMNYDGLQRTA